MMMASQFFAPEITLSDDAVTVLVVENRLLFRKIIYSFFDDTVDELVTFSSDFKPFVFSKAGEFIPDPIDVSFSSKKLQNKINSRLVELSCENLGEELFDLKSRLYAFADELVKLCDFDIDCNPDLDAPDIIKFLDFSVNRAELSLPEKLTSYITLLSKYLGTKLFIVQNLHLYFSDEELNLIYDTLLLNHVCLVALECVQPREMLDCERAVIIDEDLCTIDSGDGL